MSSTATSNGSPASTSARASEGQFDRDRLHPPGAGVPAYDLPVRRIVVDDEDPLAGKLR